MIRFDYKVVPVSPPHPAFPTETSAWFPFCPIRLSYQRGRQTPRIDAIVDSGSNDCLFRSDIGGFIGLDVTAGIKGEIGGVVPGGKIDAYFHDIWLWIGADRISIRAGFCPQISAGAILGRRGFFDNFIVTFDPSNAPPGFTIQRIGRA